MREEREALVLALTLPPPNTTVGAGLAFELSMSDLGEVLRPEGEWAEGVAFDFCLGIDVPMKIWLISPFASLMLVRENRQRRLILF
jgi:hypothetical protein